MPVDQHTQAVLRDMGVPDSEIAGMSEEEANRRITERLNIAANRSSGAAMLPDSDSVPVVEDGAGGETPVSPICPACGFDWALVSATDRKSSVSEADVESILLAAVSGAAWAKDYTLFDGRIQVRFSQLDPVVEQDISNALADIAEQDTVKYYQMLHAWRAALSVRQVMYVKDDHETGVAFSWSSQTGEGRVGDKTMKGLSAYVEAVQRRLSAVAAAVNRTFLQFCNTWLAVNEEGLDANF